MLAYTAIRMKLGGRILLFENLNKRVHVETGESPVGCEASERVAYVKLVVEKPNISLDTYTACLYGRI